MPGQTDEGICVSVNISFVHTRRSFSNYFIGPSAPSVVYFSIVHQGPYVLVARVHDS